MTLLDNAPAGTTAKNGWTLALCAAMLILFATLSYSAALTKNATYDEPLHAVSGYVIRDLGDYRIDPEDPAFFTWLSSIPHLGARWRSIRMMPVSSIALRCMTCNGSAR